MRTKPFLIVLAVLPVFACAAATTGSGPRSAHDDAIAAIHARKCGTCHTPPERHGRSRDQLEAAFDRHQERVHLTTAQWAAMVDYLAPEAQTDAVPGR